MKIPVDILDGVCTMVYTQLSCVPLGIENPF